ncbi:FAD-dependent oxidoreductase [Rugamonas sp.]|uniref:FAD-dependent oxidoreductase n=1 Tax=Rugamonas sp. TaxID=1926287 RepID=UPI0025F28CDF|nr:FAD-dependent oxidoreductase [Rugamonas sp.]
MHPIVIIGAGMAAYSLARELRKLDKTSRLTIVTADSGGSYAKPMLSNAFALNKQAGALVSASAEQMATQLDATIVAHTRVLAIDAAARTIATDGGAIAYSQLVLALGAQAIRLPLAGDAAERVLSINHIDDYAVFRQHLEQLGGPARVAILGAGLIGCEFAEDLSAAGHHVTLVDPNARPLAALAAPALSQGLSDAWATRSIALELNTTASAIDAISDATNDGALRLSLANGKQVDADIVLSAVGLRPVIALAHSAQLKTGRGIQIDRYGRTSDAHIYALGDCAEYGSEFGADHGAAKAGAVLPYVAPLLTAARAIAATLAGTPTAIELKADAVIVKTPSYKLALLPPPAGTAGTWAEHHDGERTVAHFVDDQGVRRGFGLSQHTPALRQTLLAALHTLHDAATSAAQT